MRLTFAVYLLFGATTLAQENTYPAYDLHRNIYRTTTHREGPSTSLRLQNSNTGSDGHSGQGSTSIKITRHNEDPSVYGAATGGVTGGTSYPGQTYDGGPPDIQIGGAQSAILRRQIINTGSEGHKPASASIKISHHNEDPSEYNNIYGGITGATGFSNEYNDVTGGVASEGGFSGVYGDVTGGVIGGAGYPRTVNYEGPSDTQVGGAQTALLRRQIINIGSEGRRAPASASIKITHHEGDSSVHGDDSGGAVYPGVYGDVTGGLTSGAVYPGVFGDVAGGVIAGAEYPGQAYDEGPSDIQVGGAQTPLLRRQIINVGSGGHRAPASASIKISHHNGDPSIHGQANDEDPSDNQVGMNWSWGGANWPWDGAGGGEMPSYRG